VTTSVGVVVSVTLLLLLLPEVSPPWRSQPRPMDRDRCPARVRARGEPPPSNGLRAPATLTEAIFFYETENVSWVGDWCGPHPLGILLARPSCASACALVHPSERRAHSTGVNMPADMYMLCDWACRRNATFFGQGAQTDEPEDAFVFRRLFSHNGEEPLLRQGTYLELGAHDGTLFSNSLFFERHLDWSGLLVEPSPISFQKLHQSRGSNKRNQLVHGAVGCDPATGVEFAAGGNSLMSKMAVRPHHPHSRPQLTPPRDHHHHHSPRDHHDHGLPHPTAMPRGLPSKQQPKGSWRTPPSRGLVNPRHHQGRRLQSVHVPCHRLGDLLRAASIDHVDLFSLDAEGAELAVLRTFNWSVTLGALVVEQDGHDAHKDDEVRVLLRQHGMTLARRIGWGHRNELWLGPSLAGRLVEARLPWAPGRGSWGCAASTARHCCERHRVRSAVGSCKAQFAAFGITY
jgi:hypothetical protein